MPAVGVTTLSQLPVIATPAGKSTRGEELPAAITIPVVAECNQAPQMGSPLPHMSCVLGALGGATDICHDPLSLLSGLPPLRLIVPSGSRVPGGTLVGTIEARLGLGTGRVAVWPPITPFSVGDTPAGPAGVSVVGVHAAASTVINAMADVAANKPNRDRVMGRGIRGPLSRLMRSEETLPTCTSPPGESVMIHPLPGWFGNARLGFFLHWEPYVRAAALVSTPSFWFRGVLNPSSAGLLNVVLSETRSEHRGTRVEAFPRT